MRILLTIVLILSAAALDPTPDRPTPPINYIEGCAQYDGVNSCGDCGFNYEKTEDSKCVLKAERSKDCCL